MFLYSADLYPNREESQLSFFLLGGICTNRCKVISLSIVAGILMMLSMISASAEINGTNETNPIETQTSSYNETGILEREIALNINFLTTMLQMLDLNLNLISETLNAHLEEYPFLKPTIEGTDEGIKSVNSILLVLEMNPENLSNSNATLSYLNETMAQINTSLEYPDGMIEAVNSTMGESNTTAPMIKDMYESVKTMSILLNQF